jgi:hypothetical protein
VKYIVTSRHAEDVGLGYPVGVGEEFDDKDVPDHFKDRLKEMADEGVIGKASNQVSSPKGGE